MNEATASFATSEDTFASVCITLLTELASLKDVGSRGDEEANKAAYG